MKLKTIPGILAVLVIGACGQDSLSDQLDAWKQEIIQTEADFNQMTEDRGIEAAFLNYASEDAVLLRSNKLIIGKDSIKEYFLKRRPGPGNTSLSWQPTFVEVSASGDLGYTYGTYIFRSVDSIGKETSTEGIFHTVWKRQADGNWKFVWD